MARDTKEKKIVGAVSLEDSLKKFASRNKQNRDVLSASLKMNSLMEQIVEERNFLGITQRDLAEASGIKQPMIARIEKLESIPRLDTFIRILDNLNFDIILDSNSGYDPIDLDIETKKYKIFDINSKNNMYRNELN